MNTAEEIIRRARYLRARELDECRRLGPKYAAAVEVTLWDRTRVDLLTEPQALEVDWASKWAEAIGQAAWYAIVTGRRPAVLLLVRDVHQEARYIYRATAVCQRLGMELLLEDVD